MKILKIIVICFVLLFPLSCVWAFSDSQMHQSISTLKAKTGEVIHLKWQIQDHLKTKVSWSTLDMLFAQSDKLIVLKTTSKTTSDHLFIHQIDFTVIKPQHISVKGLPVIVDGKKTLTPSFELDIKPSGLPLQLDTFMPVASVEWNALLYAWFTVLLLLFLGGFTLIVSFRKFQLWYQKRENVKEQRYILDQLVALENAANSENTSAASLVRQVNELVRQCRKVGFQINDFNLEQQGRKLLFLPDAIAKGHCADFLNEVKRCIHASQRFTS